MFANFSKQADFHDKGLKFIEYFLAPASCPVPQKKGSLKSFNKWSGPIALEIYNILEFN
jgi:hypothetical protein